VSISLDTIVRISDYELGKGDTFRMSRVIDDLKKAEQKTAKMGTPKNMLQLIRTRFTSGRPRTAKVPEDVLGPMFAVLMASNERDKIRDFIGVQGGDAANFIVKVFVVTLAPGTGRQRTWPIPDGIEAIVARADELKKIEGLIYAGLLVSVHDHKSSAVVRYARPFVVSEESSEALALASLEQRFEKGKA
jgi:hypothetical protein